MLHYIAFLVAHCLTHLHLLYVEFSMVLCNDFHQFFLSGNCNFPVVEEYGSFVMDIFSAESDLDLSVNFNDKSVEFSREKKIQILQKFAKKLYTHQSNKFHFQFNHICLILQLLVGRC